MTAVVDLSTPVGVVSPEMAAQWQAMLGVLTDELASATSEQAVESINAQMNSLVLRIKRATGLIAPKVVPGLRDHVIEMDGSYVFRPHLEYLITRLEDAVRRVEAGEDVWIRISMPPRSGKTELTTIKFPAWLIRKHPDWNYGLMAHSKPLAASWGRDIRRAMTAHPEWDVVIARDAGAATAWQTTDHGQVNSRGVGEQIAGIGFRVLIADDVIGDAADANSPTKRNNLWAKWSTDMLGRREPPTLYIVIGTRYHEDDLLGRLHDPLYEVDPGRWEVIELPAIAEADDALGRKVGDPLFSPLLDETKEQAIARWAVVKEQVGTYAWSSLYQQAPVPADGDIFNGDWYCYWTVNKKNATSDGRIRYLDLTEATGGRWLDSWDLAFKGTDQSDYVVGQRWWLNEPHRYLIGQYRKRMDFIQTLAVMREWAGEDSVGGTGGRVHERLVEDKANGPAVIRTLREEISGIVPVNPEGSKEARARAVTPEMESRNVFFPYPGDPGNEWVADLLAELNSFPRGKHDDCVDTMSQALFRMRGGATSWIAEGKRDLEEQAKSAAEAPEVDPNDREALRQAAFREQRRQQGF